MALIFNGTGNYSRCLNAGLCWYDFGFLLLICLCFLCVGHRKFQAPGQLTAKTTARTKQ